MTRTAPPATLDGTELRRLFQQALDWLSRHQAEVNAINVFPVPDGDTGTNMTLTMRAALEAASGAPAPSVGEVAGAAAHGALVGARGNSGVILSQILRGFAAGVAGLETLDGPALATAIEEGARTAYRALADPVEGTILSVARAAGAGARQAVDGEGGARAGDALLAAFTAARAMLDRTPELLPALREAGVVDSGGLGLTVLLEGMVNACLGTTSDLAPAYVPKESPLARVAAEAHSAGREYGYCTEFLVRHAGCAAEELRAALAPLGDSLLVVGEPEAFHVHIHTPDPGAAIQVGQRHGRIGSVKVDDIDAQTHAPVGAPPLAVVSVAPSEPLARVLREAGANVVVPGGQTMNPSAGELLDAIDQTGAPAVIVLPNNPNIRLAAEQAASMTEREVHVVPTASLPAGVAAALAVDRSALPAEAAAAAAEAAASVSSIEVTHAARTAHVGDRTVAPGTPIALIDGRLEVSADTLEGAAEEAVARALREEHSLLTIYWGDGTDRPRAEALGTRLQRRFSEIEVSVLEGGQPHYPYLLSLE